MRCRPTLSHPHCRTLGVPGTNAEPGEEWSGRQPALPVLPAFTMPFQEAGLPHPLGPWCAFLLSTPLPVLIFPSGSCCMLPARLSNASTCESLTKGLLCAAYVTEQAGSVHNPQEQLSAKSCPSPFGWDDPASRFTLSPGAPSPTAHNKAHESSFFMAPFLVSFLSFPTYAPSKLPSKPL